MELNDFTKKFADCFSQTDNTAIGADTEFQQLEEWGSMLTLIVIAMIDSEYGKTVTADDLKSAPTVARLFEVVSKK